MASTLTALWTIAVLVAGAWVGLNLPDIDQRIDFLLHRSIVTHGPLLPFALFLLIRGVRQSWPRLALAHMCLGLAAHMAFDIFPVAWRGYALISIPVYGWLPAWVSWLWLAGSAAVCAYWAAALVRRPMEAGLLVVGAVGIFAVAALGERTFVGPLVFMAAVTAGGAVINLFKPQEGDAS